MRMVVGLSLTLPCPLVPNAYFRLDVIFGSVISVGSGVIP